MGRQLDRLMPFW